VHRLVLMPGGHDIATWQSVMDDDVATSQSSIDDFADNLL
jgi:hypothetical protein